MDVRHGVQLARMGGIGGSVNEGFYSSLTSLNKYKLTQQLRHINNSRRPPDTDSFCVSERAPRRHARALSLQIGRCIDLLRGKKKKKKRRNTQFVLITASNTPGEPILVCNRSVSS